MSSLDVRLSLPFFTLPENKGNEDTLVVVSPFFEHGVFPSRLLRVALSTTYETG
jgi:hypothetical protein